MPLLTLLALLRLMKQAKSNRQYIVFWRKLLGFLKLFLIAHGICSLGLG